MEVPTVPLRNAACRKVACPTRVRDLFPSDSCPPELKASSVMQRFGPESRDGEGRAVHGRSDGLDQPKSKEVASVFSWLTLQCNSWIHLFLPDWILLLDCASKRDHSCVEMLVVRTFWRIGEPLVSLFKREKGDLIKFHLKLALLSSIEQGGRPELWHFCTCAWYHPQLLTLKGRYCRWATSSGVM